MSGQLDQADIYVLHSLAGEISGLSWVEDDGYLTLEYKGIRSSCIIFPGGSSAAVSSTLFEICM